MTFDDKGYYPGAYPVLFAAGASSRSFVYKTPRYARPGEVNMPDRRGVMFTPDGETFYEGVTHGGSSRSHGKDHEHEFQFSVPQLNLDHLTVKYNTKDDLVRIGGELFHRVPGFSGTDIRNKVPLPSTRRDVYVLKGEGQFDILVDNWIYSDDYDDHMLYLNGQPEPITDFRRYRDGGTTFIHTAVGVLYVPTPFKRDTIGSHPATWTDKAGVVHKLEIIE